MAAFARSVITAYARSPGQYVIFKSYAHAHAHAPGVARGGFDFCIDTAVNCDVRVVTTPIRGGE